MSDPYWNNVVFLSGFEGGMVIDEGPLAQTVTLHGTAAASSAQAKFGSESLVRSGTTSGAAVPDHASFFSGTDHFTIEGWFRFTSLTTGMNVLVAQTDYDAPDQGWNLHYYHGGPGARYIDLELYETGTPGYTSTMSALWEPTLDTWYHIAVDYDGTTYRAYVDGALIGSDASSYTLRDATCALSLGTALATGVPGYSGFDGHMDEVRITAGVARYAGAFTAPAAAFDRGPVNVFLSGFEGGSPVDEGVLAQTVTLNATAALSSAQAKFGTQSLHIAATNDSASAPDNVNLTLSGLRHFTIEFWVYATSLGAENILVSQYDASATLGWLVRHYGGGGGGVWFEFYEPSWYSGLASTWSPTLNTWHHVAVDFDGTDFRIYADGVMRGSDTHAGLSSPGDIADAAAPLMIGSANDGGSSFVGYIDEVRFTVGAARYGSDSGYTVPTAAFPRGAVTDDVISEGIGIFSIAGPGGIYFDTTTETIGAAQSQVTLWQWPRAATDNIGVTYFVGPVHGHAAAASDAIGVSGALSLVRGIILREQLRIRHTQVPNHSFQLSRSDTIGVDEALLVGVPVALSDGVATALFQQAVLSLRIIEELGLAPAVTPMLLYGKSVSESLRVADALARFLGADTSETIGIASVLAGTAGKGAQISETIGIAPAASPQLVIRVTAADTVDIDNVDALSMLYSPVVVEGIELSAAYLSPGDSITTWVMNTRSGAVTEYQNYAFNSFAKMGHKYLGASSSGLYELIGDDDDGTDIVATIKSGFAQWAGSKFTMFKSVYIAVRGGGNFVLKLITGDGREYHYSMTANDMRTTKVNVGKGLRARYFAFELISTGQDFDLDNLEFVPIVTERRV